MLGCERNVQYKKPQGTQESNGCPYPLWSMVLIYNGNCETTLLDAKKSLTLPNNVELLIIYVLLHLGPEYCSLNELNGLHKQTKKKAYIYVFVHISGHSQEYKCAAINCFTTQTTTLPRRWKKQYRNFEIQEILLHISIPMIKLIC
jgi:hypothetical protein